MPKQAVSRTPTFDGISARFAVSRASGTVILTAHGDIAGPDVDRLEAVLDDLVHGQGNLSVALHLVGVRRLDDAAARVVAKAASYVQGRGGTFRLQTWP